MTVRITFDTDNAAFADDWEGEVNAVLAQVRAILMRDGPDQGHGALKDGNGNVIGRVQNGQRRDEGIYDQSGVRY